MKFSLIITVLLVALTGCGDEPDLFKNGRQQIIAGNYDSGIQMLESYLLNYSKEAHASRAQFFLGKAYLGIGDLKQAQREFELTITNYPNSLEAQKSRYKIAFIAFLEDDRHAAIERFQEIAEDKRNPLRPEAIRMLGWLKQR